MTSSAGRVGLRRAAPVGRDMSHRWNRNPRPQPRKFRTLVSLIRNISYYIVLNWLSRALVGVGGSDFIGYILFVGGGFQALFGPMSPQKMYVCVGGAIRPIRIPQRNLVKLP